MPSFVEVATRGGGTFYEWPHQNKRLHTLTRAGAIFSKMAAKLCFSWTKMAAKRFTSMSVQLRARDLRPPPSVVGFVLADFGMTVGGS